MSSYQCGRYVSKLSSLSGGVSVKESMLVRPRAGWKDEPMGLDSGVRSVLLIHGFKAIQ